MHIFFNLSNLSIASRLKFSIPWEQGEVIMRTILIFNHEDNLYFTTSKHLSILYKSNKSKISWKGLNWKTFSSNAENVPVAQNHTAF